jgi:hypothetical protein
MRVDGGWSARSWDWVRFCIFLEWLRRLLILKFFVGGHSTNFKLARWLSRKIGGFCKWLHFRGKRAAFRCELQDYRNPSVRRKSLPEMIGISS